MSEPIYAAVDPGVNGGISHQYKEHPAFAVKMPKASTPLEGKEKDDQNQREYIEGLTSVSPRRIVAIEEVGAFTSDKPAIRMAIQKMRDNYTTLKTLFEVNGWEVISVQPKVWMRDLRLLKKGESKTDRKRRFKKFAQSKYPHLKVTLKTSDALCILYWLTTKK